MLFFLRGIYEGEIIEFLFARKGGFLTIFFRYQNFDSIDPNLKFDYANGLMSFGQLGKVHRLVWVRKIQTFYFNNNLIED